MLGLGVEVFHQMDHKVLVSCDKRALFEVETRAGH